MDLTRYQREQERQAGRQDVPVDHLPVHRWYLRIDDAGQIVERSVKPRPDCRFEQADPISVDDYRMLYHTAGENWLWADRRRMSDEDLAVILSHRDNQVHVLYEGNEKAGFYELCLRDEAYTEIKYFALLPQFTGRGLGRFMISHALANAASRGLPVHIDTCTLDHPAALENYLKSGFEIYHEEDKIYPDPRLDGVVPPEVGAHVPPARRA